MFFLEYKKHHYSGADISGAMSLDYAVTYISYTIITTIGILAFSYVHQMLSNIRRLGWFIDNKGNPRRWETWRMTTVLLVLRHFCPSASGSSLCWNAHVFSVQKKNSQILAKNCKHNKNRHPECVALSRKRPHIHRQFSTSVHGYFWDVFHPKRNNICHITVDSNSIQLSTPLIPNF